MDNLLFCFVSVLFLFCFCFCFCLFFTSFFSQEVNMMVNQQGEQLDQASDNIMTSEANVSQARQHLETSEKVFLENFFFFCF